MNTTSASLRAELLAALDDANVLGIGEAETRQAFITGKSDIRFDDLEIDSLALMQLCIAIEVRTSVVIEPNELATMLSLAELEKYLQDRRLEMHA